MIKHLDIVFEAAYRITLLTLKDQRKYLKKELADFKEGGYLHPEDVANNIKLIAALDVIIPYYGGTL